MEMKFEELLPIGSIVLLKNTTKKIMIIGHCLEQITNEKERKRFSYLGCLWPEGVIDTKRNILFNHMDIEKIYLKAINDEKALEASTS